MKLYPFLDKKKKTKKNSSTRYCSQVDGGTLKRPSLGNVSQASSMMTIATTLATSSLVDILRKPFRRKSVPNSGNGNPQSADQGNHNNHGHSAVTTTTASSGVGQNNNSDNNNHYHSDSLDGNDGSVIVDMRPIVTPVPCQMFAADNNNSNNFLPSAVSFY